MFKIFNMQTVQKVLERRFVPSKSSNKLVTDVFDRQSAVVKKTTDYLSDVIFEKTGNIFPKIKATFQGKSIATTKEELFKQLEALNLNSDIMGSEKRTRKQLHLNFSNLKNRDYKTIARISKFIHEVNYPNNPNLYRIKLKFCCSNCALSTIDKLLTHSIMLKPEEVEQIVGHAHNENFKYLDILLNSDPNQIKNSSIVSHMRNLPLEGNAEKDNIGAIRRIREKLTNIDDSKIKEFAKSKLSEIPAELKAKLGINPNCFIPNEGIEELEKIELLLDSYHSINNNFSVINGDVQNYYKLLKSKTISNNATPKEMKELEEITKLNPTTRMLNYDSFNPASQAECFNEAVRLEPLKDFLGKYSHVEPEMANYLYEKYFLIKIPEHLRESYRLLKSEFGTYVFTENSELILVDKTIYPEFDNWRKASNGKAKYPSVFDLSHAKEEFIKENYANGFFSPVLKSINLSNDEFHHDYWGMADETIRHEMAHLNDVIFAKNGTINGVNVDEIIKNRTYAKELKQAGVSDFYVDYAHTDKRELIAVAATGDYKKYSKEFKDVLVKLGMPEWVFKLKSLHNTDINQEVLPSALVEKLKNKFVYLALNNRNNNFEAIIPNGIMIQGLHNNSLEEVAEWLAEKADFNLRKIDFAGITHDEALEKLMDIVKLAKEDPKRTILQIKNFERFTIPTDENRVMIAKLKAFLTSCADKYKCTVIVETDNTSKIASEVMSDHRFQIKLDADGNSIY